jgi:pilus assembly protein CpaF
MEGEVILLQDIFAYDFRMGHDGDGHSLGNLKATGLRPHITERLADRGVKLDPTIFGAAVAHKAAVPQLGATPPVPSGAPIVRR